MKNMNYTGTTLVFPGKYYACGTITIWLVRLVRLVRFWFGVGGTANGLKVSQVGGKEFTEATKRLLGIRAKGRKVIDTQGICELRESERDYLINFDPENSDIDVINAYFWNAIAEIPI